MIRIGGLDLVSAINQFARTSPTQSGRQAGPSAFEQQQLRRRADATNVLQQALNFRGSVESATAVIDGVRARPSRAANSASSTIIGFSTPLATRASLRSSAEINLQTTSFTPDNATFSGLSSLSAAIGGVYDGAQGTGDLTFRVVTGGIRGTNDIVVRVLDPVLATIEDITIDAADPTGQVYALTNGLEVTFGTGLAVSGDEFVVSVDDDDPQSVAPGNPFDGTGASSPNFEYGVAVSAGSFEVNGTAITVDADDSIDTVAAKISASAAGVSAAFDAATERLVLTSGTAGTSGTVTVANDTSGFLAATKLAGGTFQAGQDADVNRPIDEVAALAGITTGTFFVNGIAIALDVTVDSLADVVARIDAAGAGADARLFGGNQRLEIERTDKKSELTLDDGDTAFFSNLNIATGTFAPSESRLTRRQAAEVADAMTAVLTQFNLLFAASNQAGTAQRDLDGLREEVRAAVDAVRNDLVDGNVPRFGFSFDFSAPDAVVSFGADERDRFERRVVVDFESLRNFTTGKGGRRALFDDLLGAFNQRIDILRGRAQIIGGLVNTAV